MVKGRIVLWSVLVRNRIVAVLMAPFMMAVLIAPVPVLSLPVLSLPVLSLAVLSLCSIMMSAPFDPVLNLPYGHAVTVLDSDSAVI